MRIVLQRVKSASVLVDGAAVGAIDTGLLLLLGFSVFDTPGNSGEALQHLARKVLAARVFPKDGKQWAGSAASLGLPLLLVSQFTLHGNLRKPKPDFHKSAGTEAARQMWEEAVAIFKAQHGAERVQTGVFAADMEVRLANWGPVTLTLDSANRKEAYWEELAGAGAGATGSAGGGSSGAVEAEEEGGVGEKMEGSERRG